MNYHGKDIPKLGFGLMRLPMMGTEVDIEQTKAMVDMFLGNGFKYFDTAYGYIDGKSEKAAKTCIVDRYPRESFFLATKLPAWAVSTADEAKAMLQTSLRRTGAGYFDYYLLHSLGENRTKVFEDYGIWDFAMEQKAKGVIKHMGFSFHDTADVLDEVLAKHPEAEFVQLQINYNDWESESVQARKCYEVAMKHRTPVIVMEPVKGGSLATLPEPAAKILHEANPEISMSSWAMRYAASMDGVITVLSGMSNIAQMVDNIKTMKNFAPITDAERAVLDSVNRLLATLPRIPCTECRYCVEGCPEKIDIPGVLAAVNTMLLYNNPIGAKSHYDWVTREGGVASKCIKCGQCENVCPQHIGIIEELKRATSLFDASDLSNR